MTIQTVYFADQIINQSLFKECFQCKILKFPSEFYYPGSGRCKKCVNQEAKIKRDKKRALELEQYQRFLEENNLIGKKKCPQCNQWKDPKQFSFNSRTIDKLDCWCRDCKGRHCITRYYGIKEGDQKEHPGQKKCTKCGRWKDPEEFKTSTIWCYSCRLKYGAESCPEKKQFRKKLEEQEYQKWLEENNLLNKKQCIYCKKWKNLKEFYKDKDVKDGYNGRCRECRKIIQRKYEKNNKERVKQLRHLERKRFKIRHRTDAKFNLNCRISSRMRYSLKKGSEKRSHHWESLVPYNLSQLKKHLTKTMPIGYSWQDFMNGELHVDHRIPISAFNFTKSSHIDFRRCWALTNLQLLPAKENLEKHNKLLEPFQTCFQI